MSSTKFYKLKTVERFNALIYFNYIKNK